MTDTLDPAEEIMTALRVAARLTQLEAGRELIRLKAENDRLKRQLANQTDGGGE